MAVDFEHKKNIQSISGPAAAVSMLFSSEIPRSVLDVGCGSGAWLKAFQELGVSDYLGIDGVRIAPADLLCDASKFEAIDLTEPWSLGRTFDIVLCLEVAEHLPERIADMLVSSLCAHAETVIFSAACPGQEGQGHINCQWPSYWQELFNRNGFECLDDIRPVIWDNIGIEVWYRQNMFRCFRSVLSGQEPRLRGIVHPEFLPMFIATSERQADNAVRDSIENGERGVRDCVVMTWRAVIRAITSRIRFR